MRNISVSLLSVENKEEFLNKLNEIVKRNNIEKYVSIHYDYVDNDMYKGTKCNIDDLEIICKYDFDVYVHLMAYKLDKLIKKCKKYDKGNIQIIAIQSEINNVYKSITKILKDFDVFLAVNPYVKYNEVKDLEEIINGYLLMSVEPGKGSQRYIKSVNKKFQDFYNSSKPLIIDGGINDKTITYGDKYIDCFVVGSYLTKDIDNLEENLLKLVNN